ncbi:MAG: phosphonate ABC transporter, permease protein PhnE [Candidatus Epulonipiscium fishelsonii]|nr:MAG: phosphonate ABC transporter, permease protein PhnE [Epulopiscium sp. AS2M-Bin002]
MTDKIRAKLNEQPHRWIFQFGSMLLLFVLMLWSTTTLKYKGSFDQMAIVKSIITGIFTPDLEFLFNFTIQGVPYLLLETMCIAFLGTVVGAVLAIPISFLSATNLVPYPIAVIGRIFIMAVRTVPVFVYGLMFIRVTGPGAFAGLMTMSVCSIGMVSKMYIEAIEDLDIKILESFDACGCTMFQKIRYGILPQLMPDFVSTIIYRFDMNLRDATVLGVVGAGGIGAPLIFAMNAYRWHEVGAILAGLIVLILLVEYISGKIRTKLARG